MNCCCSTILVVVMRVSSSHQLMGKCVSGLTANILGGSLLRSWRRRQSHYSLREVSLYERVRGPEVPLVPVPQCPASCTYFQKWRILSLIVHARPVFRSVLRKAAKRPSCLEGRFSAP